MSYKQIKKGVQRLSDGACIPACPGNVDYQEYLKWVAKGNKPLPEFTEEELLGKANTEKLAAVDAMILAKSLDIAKKELIKEGKLDESGTVIKSK